MGKTYCKSMGVQVSKGCVPSVINADVEIRPLSKHRCSEACLYKRGHSLVFARLDLWSEKTMLYSQQLDWNQSSAASLPHNYGG